MNATCRMTVKVAILSLQEAPVVTSSFVLVLWDSAARSGLYGRAQVIRSRPAVHSASGRATRSARWLVPGAIATLTSATQGK